MNVCTNARRSAFAVTSVVMTLLFSGANAADTETIIDSWKSVVVPSPPVLQPVIADSEHTALLILDMYVTFCSDAQRPRCVATIPRIQRLLAAARDHGMMVVYSGGPPSSTNFTMPPEALTPLPGEPMVRTNADKFVDTDLEKLLSAKGIKNVIIVGTSAEGAVLYTAGGAALRGLKVVIPVDGVSSANPFGELSTVWNLKNTSGSVASYVTLTRTDLITMQ